MSRERAFKGFFRGSSEMARAEAGAGVGVQAFKTVLRIRCKLFLIYLGISVIAAGPKSLAGCLQNSDLGGGEESGRTTEIRS